MEDTQYVVLWAVQDGQGRFVAGGVSGIDGLPGFIYVGAAPDVVYPQGHDRGNGPGSTGGNRYGQEGSYLDHRRTGGPDVELGG